MISAEDSRFSFGVHLPFLRANQGDNASHLPLPGSDRKLMRLRLGERKAIIKTIVAFGKFSKRRFTLDDRGRALFMHNCTSRP